MGKTYELIDDKIARWIERQKMFFVATAPTQTDGHVNVSPKGHDALRILDNKTLAYLDYGGSGAETIAHVRQNERIVIMMCAFDGPPNIFRFYGLGEVVTPLHEEFDTLHSLFDLSGLGARAIIKINVTRISDSCGYGVPLYDFKEQRSSSQNWLQNKDATTVGEYQVQKNLRSIDGIDAISEEEARAYRL